MQVTDILPELIRCEVLSVCPAEGLADSITEEVMAKLYALSKKYDVAQIVSSALSKMGKLDDSAPAKAFRKQLILAVTRHERMNYDYQIICDALEREKIAYIPLKGSVIRALYPEAWMRTSCDIDVLVREEDLERAINVLTEQASFTWNGQREFHDVSLHSESGTHLELHFSIAENMESIDEVLKRVWDYAAPSEDGGYRYKMTNEFLLFHIISHMAYHFINGGCGLRSFVDLYLLDTRLEYDRGKLSEICESCNMETFRIRAFELAKAWMEGTPVDETGEKMKRFIFSGGLYGDLETGTAISQRKNGGRFRYLMSRMIQPYGILSEKYPVLRKKKWLMPVYQIKRWIDVLKTDKRKRILKYVNAGKGVSGEQLESQIELLDELELL